MKRIHLLSMIMSFMAISACAQELKTGYFLDDYVYGYRLNPSAAPSDSTRFIFGLLINDITVSTASNIGASDIFFPKDGTLFNGLSDQVSPEEFIGGLPELSKLDHGMNLNILTVGIKSKYGFCIFEANVKSNSYAAVPKGTFEFLKVGGKDKTYSMGDTEINSENYVELAGGYSYKVNDNLTFGGTAKVLVGLGYANASLGEFNVKLNGSDVVSSGNGHLCAALPGLSAPVGDEGYYDLNNLKYGRTAPSGIGGAVDLGVTWKPSDNLTVSAALMDIGAIRWKTNVSGELSSENVRTPVYDGSSGKTLLGMFRFKPDGGAARTDPLPATLNVGGRYVMPFYSKLSAGLHGSFRFGRYSMTDVRMGVTFTPSHVFSMAVSGGATNYGAVFGGAFNLRLSIFDIFAGVDSFVFSITPQMLPVNKFNSTIKAGISIAVR